MGTEVKQKMTVDIAVQNLRQITDQARLTKAEHNIVEESWQVINETCCGKGGGQ